MKITSRHIFLLILIGIFGMMFFSYAESLYRQYQRDSYKKELEAEIVALGEEKSELEKLLEYVKTNEYKELKIKENLGHKLPDETVVVVPAGVDFDSTDDHELLISERPVWEQWLVYFLGETHIFK